jgi:hypothetical protein
MMDTMSIQEKTEPRNPYGDVITDSRGATWYYCSTARRYFQPDQPAQPRNGCVWLRCSLCDKYGLVKNRDPNYHEDEPQPHAYYIQEDK